MMAEDAATLAIDRLTEQVKRVADFLEKQPGRRPSGDGKPVECYVCKDNGKSVQIRLRRKAPELVKPGQSPFDLFDLDGKPHVHVTGKPSERAAPASTPPSQPATTTRTAGANREQVMQFLKAIWPNKDELPALTDSEGENFWRVTSPYPLERDQWTELAKQIRTELNGEYVSNKADHEFYFKIPKPKEAKP